MKLPRLHLPTATLILAALAGLGAVGGALVVLLGLYNVSARDGHWPGVGWVLHTTFQNSAALRAPAESAVPPDLDTPEMVALGAGHFMSGCAPCHGAPGQPRSATMRRIEPVPPPLDQAASDYSAPELFWIVHNGVKMTGMPAWPAERGDDVWPVVAFLRALPAMTAEDYTRLTTSPEGACTVCHGPRGVSRNPHVPRLDILSERYIANSLEAYRSGRRDSGIMAEALSDMTATDVPQLAAYFAKVAAQGEAGARGDVFEAGRRLASAEGGSHSVPACRACHGPWPEPLNDGFPSLAGQHAPYLEQQLKLWRDGNRGGGTAAELMFRAARDLSDTEIEALAAYYAGLAPAELNAVSE